ncbi:MAG TPA: DUF177 domain-containing protein [Saprospiraceae bacterium]|nr:DUF177 domain-containing protein [Saprospiraceae bacterium]
MEALSHFSIPFKGLKDGIHRLVFEVEDSFFHYFSNDEIQSGHFQVVLHLDKRPSISILAFELEGKCNVFCDRCLAPIHLPVRGQFQLLLKPGEPDDSTDEVMFIKPETSYLSLAQIIYEYIMLSIPMIKTYNCDLENPKPCDVSVLEKIKDKEEHNPSGTLWEGLSGFNLD